MFLGPVVLLIMVLLPLPLEANQQALIAVFSFTIVYLVSKAIPIPVTSVIALALCVILDVPGIGLNAEDSPGDIVFGSFADDTIFLFIGAFIIAQAIVTHSLDRRLAFRILTLPGLARTTCGVIIALGAIAALISTFISNTAACAVYPLLGHGPGRDPGQGHSRSPRCDQPAGRLGGGRANSHPDLRDHVQYGIGHRGRDHRDPDSRSRRVRPAKPALAAIFGASFGFMMQVSTPQNAVVYGSGMIPITKIFRSGIVFDIIGILLVVALVPVMARLVGLV